MFWKADFTLAKTIALKENAEAIKNTGLGQCFLLPSITSYSGKNKPACKQG